MIKLVVTITLPDKSTLPCGEIVTTKPDVRGAVKGAFRYTSEYLNHPVAFSIDPVNLPLHSKEIHTDRPVGVHGVFEDALPDDWGRKVLIQNAGLARKEQTVPNLLEILGACGLGALSFNSKEAKSNIDMSAGITDLDRLLDAAFRFDAGKPVDESELKLLGIHGSSPGGARPKVLIRKSCNSLWIAKFPRENDNFSVEKLEAGTLELAGISGLPVPEFELRTVGDRQVLLVKRFDVADQGGRFHMISLQTLLRADGYYVLGYDDLFNIVRQHSCRPSLDLTSLFRQMVFNAAIGNTDDHLKNFCMLHKESGYCLSPAYDLLPDIHERREHVLSFPAARGNLPPGREAFKKIGENLNIKNSDQIIEDVFQAVSGWQDVFNDYNVPDADILRLEWGITRRLKILGKTQKQDRPPS